MIWWRVGGIHGDIEPVKVVKETAHFVFVRTDRYGNVKTKKRSEYESFFPTWGEARDHIEAQLIERLESVRKAEKSLQDQLAGVWRMRKPK